jgi:hypothetical protein
MYTVRQTRRGDWLVVDWKGGNMPQTRGTQEHAQAEADTMNAAMREETERHNAAVASENATLAQRPDLTRRWATISTTLREWYGIMRHREAHVGRVERAALSTTAEHLDGRPHALDLAAQASGGHADCDRMREVYDTLSDMQHRIAVACRAGEWSDAESAIQAAEAYAARWQWGCYDVQEVR